MSGSDPIRTRKLTPEEAAAVTSRGRLLSIKSSEVNTLIFPPAGDGFSHCENGLCYVACGNEWYKFVDDNNNQFSCGAGHGKYFDCGASTFACFC